MTMLKGLAPMAWLNARIATLDNDLETMLRASRAFRKFVTSYLRFCSAAMVVVRRAYLCRWPN